jgi:hypothetical protein
MNLPENLLSVIGAVFLMGAVLSTAFMWVGAKVAKVEKATFIRSSVVATLASFIPFVLGFCFSLIPIVGTLIGIILGFVIALIAIMIVFKIGFLKSLLVWISFVIAQSAALVIASIFLGFALSSYLPSNDSKRAGEKFWACEIGYSI